MNSGNGRNGQSAGANHKARIAAERARYEERRDGFILTDPEHVRHWGANAAIVLGRLIFLADKGRDPSGYVYKSRSELSDETGLSRRQLERVTRALVDSGVLKVERELEGRHRQGGILFYRVNFDALHGDADAEPRSNPQPPVHSHHTVPPSTGGSLSPHGEGPAPHGEGPAPHGATQSSRDHETPEDPPTGGADGPSSRPPPMKYPEFEEPSRAEPPSTNDQGDAVFINDSEPTPHDADRARELLADPETAPGRLVRGLARGAGDSRGGRIGVGDVALALCGALHEGSEDAAPRYTGIVRTFADDLAKETNGRLERSVG